MRYLLVFLCFSSLVLALSVKSIDVDKRPNRIDILLNFDAYFSNTLAQEEGEGFQTLIFPNTQGQQQSFEINQFGIKSIDALVVQQNFVLMLNGDKVHISASSINKGSSYRIRITPLNATSATTPPPLKDPSPLIQTLNAPLNTHANSTQSSPPFTPGQSPLQSIETWQYVSIIAVLAGLLLILYYVKSRLSSGGGVFMGRVNGSAEHKIHIVNQVPLDAKNRLVVFEGYDMCYVVILGQNSSTLIDKFPISNSASFSSRFKSAKI